MCQSKLLRIALVYVMTFCSPQLDASPVDCECMLRACLPYLRDDMPLALQDSCRYCVNVLAQVHPNRVWILLAQLCAAANIPSPHSSMLPIKVCLVRDQLSLLPLLYLYSCPILAKQNCMTNMCKI